MPLHPPQPLSPALPHPSVLTARKASASSASASSADKDQSDEKEDKTLSLKDLYKDEFLQLVASLRDGVGGGRAGDKKGNMTLNQRMLA